MFAGFGSIRRVKSSSLPAFAFAGCGLVWGTTFHAIKLGDASLPAMWSCALRLLVAASLLSAILILTRQPWPRGRALQAAALYGLLEFGVGLPLLYWGEKAVGSGLSAVLYATGPISAMFAAKALGMEDWNTRKLAAAGLAFFGVALIYWREFLAGGSPAGLLCVLLAAASAPWAGLMLERGPRQSAVAVNAIGAWVGLPFALVASLLFGEAHPLPTSLSQAMPVLYLAVMSSGCAFVLFAWLINHWRMTTAAFLGVIVPVIAVGVGALVLKERFAPGAPIGAAIVLIGVVIALRAEGKPVRAEA
jgi:drug/metabolite transporter (DMT)-like permease